MEDEVKIGSRNSAGDAGRLQQIHDLAVENGAKCPDPMIMTFDAEKAVVFYGGEVKALGDGKIGGYLVRFTTDRDPDLTGDFFTAATDYGAHKSAPVLYQHGTDAKLGGRVIGSGDLKADDVGVWIEAQLELRDEYEQAIYEMAKSGKLGWSSGTASHLVDREPQGKAFHITRWPLGLDASLTPTPAEPRNSAIPLKSFLSGEPAPDALQSAEPEPAQITTHQESTKMADELNIDELKARLEKLEAAAAAPAVNAGGVSTKSAPAVTKNPRESASWIKAFAAWAKGDNPAGFAKGMEMTFDPSVKGAWEGGTDNEGGYAVPDGFVEGIVEQRDYASWVRQAPVMRITTNRDRVLIPTEATASTKAVVTDEEAAYDENEPVFGQVAATVYKFTKLVKVSEELMDGDAPGLESYLSSTIARAYALAENYYLTIGSGAGMPQGVLTGATASGITSASATAITAAELISTVGTLDGTWHGADLRLLMKHGTSWYLKGLTGNPFQFVQTPQGGDFVGIPALFAPDMGAIEANAKPILVGAMGMYAFVERKGMTIMRNPYLYMANGIVGVFASSRFGGAVLQTTAFKYLTQHA